MKKFIIPSVFVSFFLITNIVCAYDADYPVTPPTKTQETLALVRSSGIEKQFAALYKKAFCINHRLY